MIYLLNLFSLKWEENINIYQSSLQPLNICYCSKTEYGLSACFCQMFLVLMLLRLTEANEVTISSYINSSTTPPQTHLRFL